MAKLKSCVPYIIALAVCTFVSISVFSNSVTLDEAYSIVLVRGSVGDIINGASSDVHPPLYYLILKFASLFGGESLLLYRFMTALATYLNLLLLGATQIRKQWGNRVSVIYILWFGLTYSTLEYSGLVRMYSWAAFFVTATAVFLYSYYRNPLKRNIIIAIIMTWGAMYSHYYALITVFLIWLALLIVSIVKKEKITWIFMGGILITVGYLPWIGALFSQSRRVANNYWIKNFNWDEWKVVPAALMDSLNGLPNGTGMILYTLIIITIFVAIMRKKWIALLSVSIFFGTMLTGAIISMTVTPIWQTRYMYTAWGLVALFMAISLGEVISQYSGIVQGTTVFVLLIAGVYSYKTIAETDIINNTADEWVAYLQENVDDDSYIIFDDPGEHSIVYEFYLPDARLICTEVLQYGEGKEFFEDFLSESKGSQLWYIVDYTQQRVGPNGMEDRLRQQGYTMQTGGSFIIAQKVLEIFRVESAK